MKNKHKRWFQPWLGLAWLGLTAHLMPGCLYDPDDPCSEGMEVYGDNMRCVCPEGSAYTPQGCVTCGEHEIASASGCSCEDGYSRPSADAPCVETPSGLGAECDPAAPMCLAPYEHCEPASDSGYCTTDGCTTTDDCENGYACNAGSVCQRPPLGQGMTCESADDCAGTEATFCELGLTHQCHVQGCQLEPNDCFPGYACCDLSMFGVPELLCVPEGTCPT